MLIRSNGVKALAVLFIMFLLCSSILSGCSKNTSATGTNNGNRSDEIVVALTPSSEPSTGFDPTTGWGRVGSPLFQSTLVAMNSEANIVNDLATEYHLSKDGREYVFTLRNDVIFTDGEPLTAEDVVYTFQTTAQSGSVVDLNYLEKVEAIDKYQVKFILKTAQSPFIYAVAKTGIVPKHAHNEKYGDHPIGSGPYKFVQWDKSQQLIVEANQNYYGKKPFFKKVTFLYYNEDASFAAAKAGEIDVAFTNPNLASLSIPGMDLLDTKTVDTRGICMPTIPFGKETKKNGDPVGNDVTSDVTIRRAISIALDRQTLVNGVLNGYGEVAYSLSDGLPWYNEECKMGKDGRVEEAKVMLEKAGWIDNDGDGIREKNGIKAEFTIFYTSGDQTRQSLNIAVAEQLLPLGIKVGIEGKSWNEILENYLHTNPFLFGKGTLDPLEVYNVYSSSLKGVLNNNPGYYSNARVDEYMQKAFEATSEEEANKYWKLAQWDGQTGPSYQGDAAWIWLVKVDHLYFVKQGLDLGPQLLHPHKCGSYALTDNIVDWCWK